MIFMIYINHKNVVCICYNELDFCDCTNLKTELFRCNSNLCEKSLGLFYNIKYLLDLFLIDEDENFDRRDIESFKFLLYESDEECKSISFDNNDIHKKIKENKIIVKNKIYVDDYFSQEIIRERLLNNKLNIRFVKNIDYETKLKYFIELEIMMIYKHLN